MTMLSVHKPLRSPILQGNIRGRAPLDGRSACIAFVHQDRKESSEWRRYRY
jgi:hypothetical protein